MQTKIIILPLMAIIFAAAALYATASQQTVVSSAIKIEVKTIHDNMLGFRPEDKLPNSLTNTLPSLNKTIFELASPVAVMLTDKELNHYFFFGSAQLGFNSGYFAVKMDNGNRYLCPSRKISEDCEIVTNFQQHGLSDFKF